MNSIKRTCATCAAFNPSATEDGDACGNLTFFTEQHGTPQEWHRGPGPTDYCDSHQTHEEDAAQTQEIELARHLANATPEFLNASRAWRKLMDALGEEHPETQKATELAISLAPPSLMEYIAAQKAAAEKHNAELELYRQESTPEHRKAVQELLHLVETLGIDHPSTTRALQLSMSLAPPSMKAFMAETAKEMGLLPYADGYTEDGQPVFSLQAIAAKLDVSMDEAKAAMEAMLEDRAALGLPAGLVDPATVHRKH
jgi:hypothetical protein